MKVERITDLSLIPTILKLDDSELCKNVLNPAGCTKVEWIQYLAYNTELANGNYMRIYGLVEDKEIKGYTVVMNCFMPPMYKTFVIIYQTWLNFNVETREELALEALEKIKQWASENNCRNISVTTRDKIMARLLKIKCGFKETEDICMELDF